MAEKGVVGEAEESISRRLRRKRDVFYGEKASKESKTGSSSGIKKRRDHLPLETASEKELLENTESGGVLTSSSGWGYHRWRCRPRCDRSFFSVDCETLANRLLGSTLAKKIPSGEVCRARIVETEAYLGGEDKAAHSYNGKKTERNTAMYMQPGTAYVYSIYGMHCCFNISSDGEGAAVLIRALEPFEGVAFMHMQAKRKTVKKDQDLCNGPAKLCQAMGIDKSYNRADLVLCDTLWVESRGEATPLSDADIVKSARIGVDYAEEWSRKPLRFYIKGNQCVSKK